MGLKDKMIKKAAEIEERRPQFTPLELNEGNVQAIFNRCKSKGYDTETLWSDVFRAELGHSDKETTVFFEKNAILQNKRTIQYLFGQLAGIHQNIKSLSLNQFYMTYGNHKWTTSEDALMKLLYLGACNEINCIFPFSKKQGDTSLISSTLFPTLSPKDPNFPAWWEAHKGEWEA